MDSLNIAGKAVRLCIDKTRVESLSSIPQMCPLRKTSTPLRRSSRSAKTTSKPAPPPIAEGDGSKLEKSRAELALTREAFAFLREGIDRTFGPGTAQTVFGSRDSVAMAARFFRGVTPYIRKRVRGSVPPI